jgi:hypothetical protein
MDLLSAIKTPPWLAIENLERQRPSALLVPYQDEGPRLVSFDIAGNPDQLRFSKGSRLIHWRAS